MDRNASIGKYIASLRDQADLKQNELAKKLPWSAAVLSRIESGERSLADDELEIVLDGIGTPDALKLKEISYIHAEGYPAAEMKHGPIALIDAEMPGRVLRHQLCRPGERHAALDGALDEQRQHGFEDRKSVV